MSSLRNLCGCLPRFHKTQNFNPETHFQPKVPPRTHFPPTQDSRVNALSKAFFGELKSVLSQQDGRVKIWFFCSEQNQIITRANHLHHEALSIELDTDACSEEQRNLVKMQQELASFLLQLVESMNMSLYDDLIEKADALQELASLIKILSSETRPLPAKRHRELADKFIALAEEMCDSLKNINITPDVETAAE